MQADMVCGTGHRRRRISGEDATTLADQRSLVLPLPNHSCALALISRAAR